MTTFNHSKLLTEIFQRAAEMPEKTALVSCERAFSYRQLTEAILKNVEFLCSFGLKKGDRIALSAKKDVEFVFLYFAAHLMGVVNVVVDSETNPTRLNYILEETQPSFIFGFASDRFPCSDFLNIDSFWGSEENYENDLKDHSILTQNESNLTDDDVADILFTTGTTGKPKGVLLSHRNIIAAVKNINDFIGNKKDDVEAIGLPICHSFGLGRLRCSLACGQTVVLLGSYANLKVVFAAFERYCVTGFAMVPAVWAYLRKFSGTRIVKFASQIRYIEIGSAPMPIESKKELCELFPQTRICMHYGLTEASRSVFLEFHEQFQHIDSIGVPVSNEVSVKIFDASGKEISTGEPGELCIKGNMVTSRPYLNEKEKTAFWGDYFRTGDFGRKDENGCLYLVSRLKEMINVGGKKVSPVEVEDAICQLGAVDAVCVGVNDPNGILGEVVKAYVLKPGCSMDFKEITNGLHKILESYKIPVFYEWIEEIPKTASGKKQRLSLKQN